MPEPTTTGPASHDPTPHDLTPHDPTPHDPTPHDPTPHDPASHDPASHDPTPHDSTLAASVARARRPNVLLITLDQFRGDALSCAGHPVVRTPHLDALAAEGVRFARHYSQAAPCSPGRAALYTGTYQMTNRVVANGTPLDDRFDNVARVARRAGYAPTLFGYTDQGIDPRLVTEPDDPRLSDYEGVLPGFDVGLDLAGDMRPWRDWLAERHGVATRSVGAALTSEPARPAEQSVSAFLTDRLLAWLGERPATDAAFATNPAIATDPDPAVATDPAIAIGRERASNRANADDLSTVPATGSPARSAPAREPWFVHASYLRPHPPFAAAGEFATRYDPDHCGMPIAPVPSEQRHPLHDFAAHLPAFAAPADAAAMRALRAQYFGMISEVDAQLGRLWARLRERGEWDDTLVVVTADHGEQLGDHGLLHKLGFFEQSYHVPAIVRDPRRPHGHGTVVDAFTENVDLLPTICEAIGMVVPGQCDGVPLTPFLDGRPPAHWRDAAHYEFDWREVLFGVFPVDDPADRRIEHAHLAVRRSAERAFVHFGDGTTRCFDLVADPTWRTEIDEPAIVLAEATAMLDWRTRHLDRTMTGFLLRDGGTGRRPIDVSQRRRDSALDVTQRSS